LNKKIAFTLIVGFIVHFSSFAQQGLGFCQGNSGEAIFEEDFGQGTDNGPPLPPGTTSYTFVNRDDPRDGEYTISNSTSELGWNLPSDHTGNEDSKALIVNADSDTGEFFRTTISGLCANNSYEFSAWLINILPASGCDGEGIPVNVKFEILDETGSQVLAEGDTGNIFGTDTPTWNQYGLTFTSLPGQTSVILRMLNNAPGGCGNDLAIDDIAFKSCGDFTEIISENNETNIQFCEGETLTNYRLEAIPDFSVYDSPNYQWQVSNDGETWTNIPGETNHQILIPEISETIFYRTLVAEDSSNLNNQSCNSISNVFEFEKVDFIEPISLGDVFVCENETQSLAVEENPNITVNWYDSEVGGNLLAENTFEYLPNTCGTFFAEAVNVEASCVNPERVEIEYVEFDTPELNDEVITACEGDVITLTETVENADYLWSTGETTNSIEVTEAGNYELEILTEDNCLVSKLFTVETLSSPEFENISQSENSLTVTTVGDGNYMYSIDGVSYQNQPTFNNLQGGLYTVYVRENNGCGIVTEDFLFFRIPEFFTPNGDQINDTFKIEGDIFFDSFEITIFDRYGKVLARSQEAPFEWDGTYNGKQMPEDDYWYKIKVDGKTYSGNITLIR
jgi:gliding motility-associated-like protein